METTKKIEKIECTGKEVSQEKELNEYFFDRFVASLKKQKTDQSILINELDSITEGKNIILSNAH